MDAVLAAAGAGGRVLPDEQATRAILVVCSGFVGCPGGLVTVGFELGTVRCSAYSVLRTIIFISVQT